MNYTIVINGALWGGAILYYVLFARKWFKGPKTTVGEESPASNVSATVSQTHLDGKDGK
jgi:hypothetical protein